MLRGHETVTADLPVTPGLGLEVCLAQWWASSGACDVAVRSVVPPSADLNEQSLLLEVWDKDRIGKNDFMGAMVFRLADLQEDKTGCVCARVCVPLCLSVSTSGPR